MKKYTLLSAILFAIAATVFVACSSSTKLARSNFTGNWTVTDVQFEGIPANTKIKSQAFDDVPASCFKGSTWSLPNNGYGSYTIQSTQDGCTTGTRQIIWSYDQINGVNYFQFKKLDGTTKAKNVAEGYRVEMSNVMANSFTLRSPVSFEGQTITIVYYFSKQ